MDAHQGGDGRQDDPGDARTDEDAGEDDAKPHHTQGAGLVSRCHRMVVVVGDVLPEDPVSDQIAVQAFGTAGEAESRQQQEGGGGQDREDDARRPQGEADETDSHEQRFQHNELFYGSTRLNCQCP